MAPICNPKTQTRVAAKPYARSHVSNVIKDVTEFEELNPQQAKFLEENLDLILPLLPDAISFQARLRHSSRRESVAVQQAEELDAQPAGLNGVLTPYQMKGLDFLLHLHWNKMPAILADDMGLGKTIQVIALIRYLRSSRREYPMVVGPFLRPVEPFLIVVPLSTLGNWKAELTKWCGLEFVEFHGEKEKTCLLKKQINSRHGGVPEVVVTTYEQVLKDRHFFMSTSWRYLILDEAHRAKNSKSDTWKVLTAIPSRNRLAMSGTPIQNNLEELWSLLAFLYPHVFKDSATKAMFKQAFDPSKSQIDQAFFQKVSKFLEVIMLRRTKEDVKESLPLPPKTEIRIFVPLSAYQKALYLQAVKQNVGIEKLDIFASSPTTDTTTFLKRDHQKLSNLLQHLRKICTHPFLVTGEEPGPLSDLDSQLVAASGKFIALEKIIRDTVLDKKRKLVIFSSFTQTLKHCEALLRSISADRTKFKWCSIIGKLHRAKRNLNIRLFQSVESEYSVMLVSTKAGGEGINLTAAQDSVFIDEDWNPQSTLQAESRTHRMGQKGNVTIYKLCTQGTVEEQMLKRIYKKLYLSTKIMDQVGSSKTQGSTTEGDAGDLDMRALQRMQSDDIAKLIRIGTTALVHDEIKIEDMIKWDLATLVTKCRGKSDEQVPSGGAENSSATFASEANDEEQFLKSEYEIKAQVFQGQNLGGDTKSKKRKRQEDVDLILDHSSRRNGKDTVVMVDGYAVKKINLGVPTKTPVAEPQYAMVEPKKSIGKAKVTARQSYCGACLDAVADTDPTCYACPRSYHVACTGQDEAFFAKRSAPWSCKQHECAHCGLKAAKTGGFTHRCRTCEKGFCDDCIAKEWDNCINIGDSLPEFVDLGYPVLEQAWYVVCPSCCEDPERVRQALARIKRAPKKLKLKLKGWNSYEETADSPAVGTKRKRSDDKEPATTPITGKKRKLSGNKETATAPVDDTKPNVVDEDIVLARAADKKRKMNSDDDTASVTAPARKKHKPEGDDFVTEQAVGKKHKRSGDKENAALTATVIKPKTDDDEAVTAVTAGIKRENSDEGTLTAPNRKNMKTEDDEETVTTPTEGDQHKTNGYEKIPTSASPAPYPKLEVDNDETVTERTADKKRKMNYDEEIITPTAGKKRKMNGIGHEGMKIPTADKKHKTDDDHEAVTVPTAGKKRKMNVEIEETATSTSPPLGKKYKTDDDDEIVTAQHAGKNPPDERL